MQGKHDTCFPQQLVSLFVGAGVFKLCPSLLQSIFALANCSCKETLSAAGRRVKIVFRSEGRFHYVECVGRMLRDRGLLEEEIDLPGFLLQVLSTTSSDFDIGAPGCTRVQKAALQHCICCNPECEVWSTCPAFNGQDGEGTHSMSPSAN